GRDHARGDRRGDRRIRRLQRRTRVSASERYLAARFPACFRRPVRAVVPWHVRLSAGRTGGTASRALAAAGAAKALSHAKKSLEEEHVRIAGRDTQDRIA